MKKLGLAQRGDTIIEVMIALSVLGLTLAIGYSVASRGLIGQRQAQERSEALKYIQAQIEQLQYLKPYAADPSKNIYRSNAFCITDTQTVSELPGGTPTPDVESDNLDVGGPYTTANCQKSELYNLSIKYDPTTDDQFALKARWERLGGGRDELVILYRLHP